KKFLPRSFLHGLKSTKRNTRFAMRLPGSEPPAQHNAIRVVNWPTRMLLQKENTIMRHFDFTPLYRSTVGFDRLFSMLDSITAPESAQSYPPYNIERTGEDAYRITMAVAGFAEEDLSIEA